ncbi:MAG: diguanylate cyclase domain-containing protein, partial [Burkholderiaceae bacterium]
AYTISIGVAVLGRDSTHPDDALTRADRAMYQAKTTGRNRVCADATDPMPVAHPSDSSDSSAT